MKVLFSPDLAKTFQQLKKKDPRLLKQIEKQLQIFSGNPKHVSLRLHKLSGNLNSTWSISVSKSYRLVFVMEGDEAYFFNFGTHDQVYRKK